MNGKLDYQLIDDYGAAQILGFKNPQTLRNWRHLGRGPSYCKIGRCVRYRISDLLHYIESKKIELKG